MVRNFLVMSNKRIARILVPAALLAGTVAGCSAAASGATAAPSGTGATTTGTAATADSATKNTHLTVFSVNSDGPDFKAIVTGAVGDYGPAETVTADGAVDPSHSGDLELQLSQGTFKVSISALDAAFVKADGTWPVDQQTCSIHGSVTGWAPVVAGSGTGAYSGISGGFTLTITLDEDFTKGASCSESSPFQAQLIQIAGTGAIRV